jgi:excisionase family DNA binding protein
MNKNDTTQSSGTARPAELVNVAEAARFLAVSPSTLYGWVWQRRIAFVKVGRAVRFDMADLKQFVARNRIQARVTCEF